MLQTIYLCCLNSSMVCLKYGIIHWMFPQTRVYSFKTFVQIEVIPKQCLQSRPFQGGAQNCCIMSSMDVVMMWCKCSEMYIWYMCVCMYVCMYVCMTVQVFGPMLTSLLLGRPVLSSDVCFFILWVSNQFNILWFLKEFVHIGQDAISNIRKSSRFFQISGWSL